MTNYPELNTYAKYYTPGIVDIMPSIARFMNVTIPVEVSRELDGLPLIGTISLAEVNANHFQRKLDVTWKALESEGLVKIWVATTNEFKNGGKDNYRLMVQVPLAKGYASVDLSAIPSSFYKIVVEGSSNCISKWIVVEDK